MSHGEMPARERAECSAPLAPPPHAMPMRPSTGAAPTAYWAAGSSGGSSPPNLWSVDPRPPNVFMSYFQNQQYLPIPPQAHPSNFPSPHPASQNFHFVGVPPHSSPFAPPPTPHTPSPSLSAAKVARPNNVASKKKKEHVLVVDDDDDEPSRTAQRLTWSYEEDKRLANAWLENSADPIDGNNTKVEKYWNDIAADYNSNTPKDRRREAIQLKLRFHRVKTKINEFHGCWSSVTKVYRSGFSDDQLTKMALEQYLSRRKKPFTLVHMWEVLKDHGKWLAYRAKLNGEANKSPSERIDLTLHVAGKDREQRPIGCKSAKDERNGKRKTRDAPEVVMVLGEKLDKFIEVQAESKLHRQKVIETQQQMSKEKLEMARLEKETKMFDVYKEMFESRGFPGMLGSLDCMHWHWEKCPMAWKGQFTRGDQGVPTLILEAVASQDLRIWHAYFGIPGSNNDINVLNSSCLFTQQLRGEAPQVHYSVNGNQYNHGYYLVDGIYPEWAVFVKSITLPQTEKHKLFAKHQEGARKDVERAFGVLQGRFRILGQPACLHDRGDLQNIMLACIILHNMIVEDEKELAAIPLDLNEPGSTSAVLPPVFTHGNIPEFADVLRRDSAIRARPTHVQLKRDLVENIWQKFGAN